MPRGSSGDGEAVAVLSKVAVDIAAVEGEARFRDLLRGLDIEWPNHVWCTDITYIRAHRGFLSAVRPTWRAQEHRRKDRLLADQLYLSYRGQQVCPEVQRFSVADMAESGTLQSAVSADAGAGKGTPAELSFLNALPYFAPVAIFPFVAAAALYGGWWLAGSVRLSLACGPVRHRVGHGRAKHRPETARRPVVLAQARRVGLGRALSCDLRVRVPASFRRRISGVMGRRSDRTVPGSHGPAHPQCRPRHDAPSRRVGAPHRRIPDGICLLPAGGHGAHLRPSRPHRHAQGRRIRAEGSELLAIPAPICGPQLLGHLACRTGPAGAPPPAGLAPHEPGLALRSRNRRVVCAGLLDRRRLGRAGLRRHLRYGHFPAEDGRLRPALRIAAHPPARRSFRAGPPAAFLEHRLQVVQLVLLQRAASRRPPHRGNPALPAAATFRAGRGATTAGKLLGDGRPHNVSRTLVPEDGPAGRPMARAFLSRDR